MSVLLSVVGAAFLLAHLIAPGRRVDGWTFAFLFLVFLPWLGPIFESIGFPGASIKFRELTAKQEQQDDEIKALQFLVANFLTRDETKYLRIFASPDPLELGPASDETARMFSAIERFKQLGFVHPKKNLDAAALTESQTTDLKTMFEITETGREYLKLRDSTSDS